MEEVIKGQFKFKIQMEQQQSRLSMFFLVPSGSRGKDMRRHISYIVKPGLTTAH